MDTTGLDTSTDNFPIERECRDYLQVRDLLIENMPQFEEYWTAIEDAGSMFIVFGTLMWQGHGRLAPHANSYLSDTMRFVFRGHLVNEPHRYLVITWGTGISRAIFGRDIISIDLEIIER